MYATSDLRPASDDVGTVKAAVEVCWANTMRFGKGSQR
jgi:hypothetical protein